MSYITELADLLDRLSTSADALVFAGDINIRLERVTDPNTVEFLDLIAGYGLTQQVSCATHDAGGTLDVVCTQYDLATPTVDCQTIACCCGQCRRRPSNAWFDDECREAKRLLRTQERVARRSRRSGSVSDLSSPAVQTWRLQRRRYFSLLRDKKTSFWMARVNADQQHPRRL